MSYLKSSSTLEHIAPPKTPVECRDWIGERMENALRIAMTKEGEDRAGWLEDAHYFSSVLSILIKEVNAARKESHE